jgi:hypothetical protein
MSGKRERRCHHCGQPIGETDAVGRRDRCLQCDRDLHCCLNCSWYDPSYHNQCREPQAERQVDKEAANFCDYFTFRVGAPSGKAPTASTREQLEGLFRKRP